MATKSAHMIYVREDPIILYGQGGKIDQVVRVHVPDLGLYGEVRVKERISHDATFNIPFKGDKDLEVRHPFPWRTFDTSPRRPAPWQ